MVTICITTKIQHLELAEMLGHLNDTMLQMPDKTVVQRKILTFNSIQINQPTRCNSFTSLLLDVYVWFNMFWAPICPSSGAYNCTRSLWFYHWSVVGHGFNHD